MFFVFQAGGYRVSGIEDDNLQYGFCAGAKRPLYFEYINIQPWPVPLAPNQELDILAHILLYQDITAGSRVKLDITKKTGGMEVDIPCLDTPYGPLGSCSYQGDVLTETLFHQFFCPDNAKDQPCALPVLAGHYGQQYDDPYHVTLPNITLYMDWFLSGTFNIKATVVDDSREEFTCLEFVVEVEEKYQTTSSPVTSPGPDTCQDCLYEMNRIVEALEEKDMLEKVRDYLTLHACEKSPDSPACQELIWENWSEKISSCLFSSSWILDQLTCLWYGQCQGIHKDWECEQVGTVLWIRQIG